MRAAAALLAALALVAGGTELPHSMRVTQDWVEANADKPRLQRELAPAYAFGLAPDLALRADEILPREAVYTVLQGGDASSARDAQPSFTAYWLLPRRYTLDPRQAEWIVNYGADASQLGLPLEVVADDVAVEGWQILRVRG